MSPRIPAIVALGLLICLPSALHADPARDAVVASYLHALGKAGTLVPSDQLDNAESNPDQYASKDIEETGTVSGFVTSDTGRIALLTVGAESLAIDLPDQIANAPWFVAGTNIRVLLKIDPPAAGSLTGKPVLIAAAPDFYVAIAEHAAAEREYARLAAQQHRLGSRSGDPRAGIDPGYSLTGGHPDLPLSPSAQKVFGAYRDFIRTMNWSLSDAEVDKITSSILYYSDLNQVDPRLIVAMIIAESGFDVDSTSRTGAMGLGQLMPETAREMGVTNAYDPQQNISAAVSILRGHLDQYGGTLNHADLIPFDQIALTMAAYNAGPGAVSRYHGVPPYRETQRYVAKVASLYRQMCGQGQ